MAVDVTLLNSNSLTNIQTNFERVEAAFQEVLGREGDTPNSMNADIDMDGNDVLNVGRIDVQEFYMDGQPIASIPAFEEIVAIAPDIVTVASISNEIVNVSNNIVSIDLVGSNINDVITVSNNIPNIDAVVADEVDIGIVAGNIGDVNTVANNIVDIQNAEENAQLAIDAAIAAEASEANVALAAVPLGTVLMQNGEVDDGYLRFGEGGSYDRNVLTDFAAWMDANGETAFGLTPTQIANGELPEWRDYSPRTAGGALGPAVGETQEDAFQGHDHDTGLYVVTDGTINLMRDAALAPGTAVPGSNRVVQASTSSFTDRFNQRTGAILEKDANGAPRTASETRVKSFGVRWQIKAYGAFVNQGTADLVAIEQGYQTMLNGAVRGDIDQTGKDESWKQQARNNTEAGVRLQAAVATTSGTAIDLTGIPAGVKRVTVLFQGVSLASAGEIVCQLGTVGGIETVGYSGNSVNQVGGSSVFAGTYFVLTTANTAVNLITGKLTFERFDANTWVMVSALASTGSAAHFDGAGSKTLAAELTTVRISGVLVAFDAGSVVISWEF